MYLLQLFDNYAASYSLMFIGIVELLAISWVYGENSVLFSVTVILVFIYRRYHFQIIFGLFCSQNLGIVWCSGISTSLMTR